MANLTLRQIKGSPLTITEMDGNFEYFTGSYTNTGTITAQGFSGSFTGSLQGTAQTASYVAKLNQNVIISGSLLISGSIIPNTNGISSTSSFNLGSPTNAWKDIYVSDGTINFLNSSGTITQTIGLGNNQLTGDTWIDGKLRQGLSTITAGQYSHAEGNSTTASGDYSHAEGNSTKASGSYSHAEGAETTANGQSSHAEGISTTTNGFYSHAEGVYTTTIGLASHAEGFATVASGAYSHAEGGNTITSGRYSHAEGSSSIAAGTGSHSEGFNTVALGSYQHVQGQYNISSSAQSAFIVGNGTSDATRSNLIFASGSQVQISGSLTITSSLILSNTQSIAPSYTGVNGEIIPAKVGSQYLLYMWMDGAWRSSSFA